MGYGLSALLGSTQPSYRKIFPSYDWDEDVWRVNQIINLPNIVGKENIGFIKNVPNEEIKRGDRAVEQWINEHMDGCSCLIVFCGEKTAYSKWVLYEIKLADRLGLGRFIINLKGMLNQKNEECQFCHDPYMVNNLYVDPTKYPNTYTIRQYDWIADEGIYHIHDWIEDACQRANR